MNTEFLGVIAQIVFIDSAYRFGQIYITKVDRVKRLGRIFMKPLNGVMFKLVVSIPMRR